MLASDDKKARCDRAGSDEIRRKLLASDAAARDAIAEYLKIPRESITFQIGQNGKPFADGINIHFNISHSGDIVVCGISEKRLGIDTEEIRLVRESMIEFGAFDSPEYLPGYGCDKYADFLRIWTLKESFIKLNAGSIVQIRDINVKLLSENSAEICGEPVHYKFYGIPGYVTAAMQYDSFDFE